MRGLLVSALCAAPLSAQAVWPELHGPERGNRVASASLPLTWSEDQNVRWKSPVPGEGWSSPVVGDGRAWMTTSTDSGRKLHVLAYDVETGALVHQRVVFEVDQVENKNALNSHASPTPVVEPGRLYVHFGTYGTCLLYTSPSPRDQRGSRMPSSA